jgi:hypothetical protein
MKILTAHNDETAKYAAEELKKYIELMTGNVVSVNLYCSSLPPSMNKGEIHLGFLHESAFPPMI